LHNGAKIRASLGCFRVPGARALLVADTLNHCLRAIALPSEPGMDRFPTA
jgi:hypothetical protein